MFGLFCYILLTTPPAHNYAKRSAGGSNWNFKAFYGRMAGDCICGQKHRAGPTVDLFDPQQQLPSALCQVVVNVVLTRRSLKSLDVGRQ